MEHRGMRTYETTGSITAVREDDGQVLHLRGDVDAPVINDWKTGHPFETLHIVAVDVGAMTYIDSTGLTFLVRWAQSARGEGRPAEIRNTTRRFERVLEVAGLSPLFDRV